MFNPEVLLMRCARPLAAFLGVVLVASTGVAHILIEAPWHALAYGYRSAVFLIDIEPIDWPLIDRKLTTDDDGRVLGAPAQVRLEALDAATGSDHWPAVEQALAVADAHGLYAALTPAMAHAIRYHLAEAEKLLDQPGGVAAHLGEAEQLYRVFADVIRQTDPDGFRELGLAWLDLASTAGHAGVVDVGGKPADATGFAAARAIIEDYLVANYEPAVFAVRASYAPIPEQVLLAEPDVRVAPWLPPGSNINDQNPLPRLVLNFEEQGIDETDLPLIAYGDMLFDSPEIFGEPARSLGLACSTCHNRSDINRDFFIPGISPHPGAVDVDGSFFNPLFNDHRADAIDIPSLRGLRFTGPYGRDGRFASLRDFTRNVIVNEFAGAEPTPFMLDAIVGYMLEFDFLPNAKVTPDGRLTAAAPAAAHRGEAIFKQPFAQMDGKACASCHLPSANFLDRKAHDIGSVAGGYEGARNGALDTPTLLAAKFTAPYFHDGALPTLASVVDWFDARYGLDLDDDERVDLTAYLEAIGDADQPYQVFAGRATPFRLGWEELTTFASTLDTLIPLRDAHHATLMIDTVAADLAADASAMANRDAQPEVYALATRLTEVGAAIATDDWALAEQHWQAFKAQQVEIDERMF